MNTTDIDDSISLPDSVGVHRSRLVVTTRPIDYGTFAVTTNNNWTIIPYARATSFRINNYTGKMLGVRRRHKKLIVENFNDRDFADWTGSVIAAPSMEGYSGGYFQSLAHRPLTTQVMLDGSEVEATFRTPVSSTFSLSIKVWDDSSRIGVGNPAANYTATQATLDSNTKYRVSFRLRPTLSEYDYFIEKEDGGRDDQLTTVGETGEFGASSMIASVVSVECTGGELNVDPIIYQQKVNWSQEQMGQGASFIYPCEDNISEYEILNLGSDALNYTDNTDNVSLGGFYAV